MICPISADGINYIFSSLSEDPQKLDVFQPSFSQLKSFVECITSSLIYRSTFYFLM